MSHISVSILDSYTWECITEVMKHPERIRARVEELRQELKPPISPSLAKETIVDITTQMENLFSLAQHAISQKTIDSLGILMQNLEKQKLEAEALLLDVSEDDEERA